MALNKPKDSLPRILIVTSILEEVRWWGFGHSSINLVDELVSRGVNVDVIFKEGED